MRKIPTVFVRDPENPRYVTRDIHPDCQWVFDGEGAATRKYDGTCVLIRRDGLAVHAFARREVKPGKAAPDGFVLIETDPITGKSVGWEPADQSGFAKFIAEAISVPAGVFTPGTYELCGPKINGNPEHLEAHTLIQHATAQRYPKLDKPTSWRFCRGAMAALREQGVEGIVWHHPDGRMAKLKTRDMPSYDAAGSSLPHDVASSETLDA